MTSASSYELIRWSKDKVVLQVNPPDKLPVPPRTSLSPDCPEKVTMVESLKGGSELLSIRDLPKYLGLSKELDAEIAAILSE